MSDDIEIQKTIRRLTRRYNAPGHELVNDDGPAAVAIIEALQAEVERLKGVLGKIARQTTSDEVDNDEGEFVDYQGGWDTVVTLARSALEAKP